jgi:hypothetical protein
MQSKQYLIDDSDVQNLIATFWLVRVFLSEEDSKAAGDSNADRWNKLDDLRTTIDLAFHRLNHLKSLPDAQEKTAQAGFSQT